MSGGSPLWPLALIIPAAFAAIWTLVFLILTRVSGWAHVAADYPAGRKPPGAEFNWVTGFIGGTRYNNVLTVVVSPEGLYLAPPLLFSIGHRPLLVPWHAVRNARRTKTLWLEFVDFDIGEPALTHVRLPRGVMETALLRYA